MLIFTASKIDKLPYFNYRQNDYISEKTGDTITYFVFDINISCRGSTNNKSYLQIISCDILTCHF